MCSLDVQALALFLPYVLYTIPVSLPADDLSGDYGEERWCPNGCIRWQSGCASGVLWHSWWSVDLFHWHGHPSKGEVAIHPGVYDLILNIVTNLVGET